MTTIETNSPDKVIANPPVPVEVPAGAGGEVDRYISLWQPWASLWVAGEKLIETRGWGTKFRGRIAVHAGKKIDVDACERDPFVGALMRIGFNRPSDLPRGALIGWVTITDCLEMGSVEFPIRPELNHRLTTNEHAFGEYSWGRFAWTTSDERRVLAAPIPMRGLQRIQKLPPQIARWLST